MELSQPRVKKIKVKKPKPATFKNRLTRSIKTRTISDKWLRNILLITALTIFLSTIIYLLVGLKISNSKSVNEETAERDRKKLENEIRDEARRKQQLEQTLPGK